MTTITSAARRWHVAWRQWNDWHRPDRRFLSDHPVYQAAMRVHDRQWLEYVAAREALIEAIEAEGGGTG